MDKERLDEIRARAEADLIHGRPGSYLDQLEKYLDFYRHDIPDLLDYIEELEDACHWWACRRGTDAGETHE